jgi:hypothetical protein
LSGQTKKNSPLELHAAVHGATEIELHKAHAAKQERDTSEFVRVHSRCATQVACGYLNHVRT